MVTMTDKYPTMFPHEEAAQKIVESIHCDCRHKLTQHSPNSLDVGFGMCRASKCRCKDYRPYYSQIRFANIIRTVMENHGYSMPQDALELVEPRDFYWKENEQGFEEVWELHG